MPDLSETCEHCGAHVPLGWRGHACLVNVPHEETADYWRAMFEETKRRKAVTHEHLVKARAEVKRLRGAIERHHVRKQDRLAIHEHPGKYGCLDCDLRLWSVLDPVDNVGA